MGKLQALLFDFDGTLVDTEKFHFEMMNEFLKSYGGHISWEEYIEVFMGVPFSKNTPMLVERFKLPMTPTELVDQSAVYIEKGAKSHPIMPMPGVIDTLEDLKHLRKAIVTGSGRASVTKSIQKLGWSDQFEFWVTFDDVKYSKPHPESYLQALNKLGVSEDQVVVFEDTKNGTASAKAAGLTCLAIQQHSSYHPQLAEADQIFMTISEAILHLKQMGFL